MTATNYGLVVISAVLLAATNFLVKRAQGSPAFVGIGKVAEGVLLAPLLFAGGAVESGSLQSAWPLPLVGAALLLMSNVLMAAATRQPDLSLLVPASRVAMLAAIPLVALLALGESTGAVGGAGIAVIVVGVACLPLRGFGADGVRAYGQALGGPGTRHAVLAGLVAAGSTVWDKRSVQVLSPAAYLAAYSGIVGIVHALVLQQSERGAVILEWRKSWQLILLVAALGAGSSLLALVALQTENAGYVVALRQISVALGAALGARWLGEKLPPPAIAGIGLVLGGCVLLALAS